MIDFWGGRASYASYGYRSVCFLGGTGIIRLLWLPFGLFFGVDGYHTASMVTVRFVFWVARASYAFYGYRSVCFLGWTGIIQPLWLPFGLFFGRHGHHTPSMVTVRFIFWGGRVSYSLYGYRSVCFLGGTGIIRLLWLPFGLFFGVDGHHTPPMVTVRFVFWGGRVSYSLYGYRSVCFLGGTGIIRLLWLPFGLFFGWHGHHTPSMVTVRFVFWGGRASYGLYGYRSVCFWGWTGTIRLLWLPFGLFFWVDGHHTASMVTVRFVFWVARASYAFYGYRSVCFWGWTGTIRLLWLPLRFILAVIGHHTPPMVTVAIHYWTARASYTRLPNLRNTKKLLT